MLLQYGQGLEIDISFYLFRMFPRDDNTIEKNTIKNNDNYGIYLYISDNNIVRENTLKGNKECIYQDLCEGNIIENNECDTDIVVIITIIVVIAIVAGSIAALIYLYIRVKKKRVLESSADNSK